MSSSYLRGDDPTVTPLRIHADREAASLRIEWADAHHTVYSLERLRWLCPCAYCRGEMGQPGWLDTNPELTSEQVRLSSVETVGSYAIAPTWGDGHHTGFYPYALLRAACACNPCEFARGDEDAGDDTAPGAAPQTLMEDAR